MLETPEAYGAQLEAFLADHEESVLNAAGCGCIVKLQNIQIKSIDIIVEKCNLSENR